MEAVLAREVALKGTTRDVIYRGYASGTSMRSFIRAADVAAMAVFLASDAARFVSGGRSRTQRHAHRAEHLAAADPSEARNRLGGPGGQQYAAADDHREGD
jgi:hypothetical protein